MSSSPPNAQLGERFPDSEFPGPGTVIADRYQVEKLLGAGGMGVVLAARHVQLGHRVAIKVMRGSAARDGNAVGRFLREARAAVALSSERVAKVADVGTLPNGAPYMVMEFLSGRDLGEVVHSGGPMAIPVAIDAVLQACEAIAEAHALGIIHRDLKPSNLFLTTGRDGKPLVKVLDFGIATAASVGDAARAGSLTETGMVMGSPGYMSPEQIRNSKAADARSDVWSLGVILYELLTGEPPFAGETFGEIFARILSEDPPSIRRKRPDVPPELEKTILQCLERDPKQRTQSVAALAPKLARFAQPASTSVLGRIASFANGGAESRAAEPASVRPPARAKSSPGETASPWLTSAAGVIPKRRLVTPVAVAASAAAAIFGIGFLVMGRVHATSDAPRAPSAGAPVLSAVPAVAEPPGAHEAPVLQAWAGEPSAGVDAGASSVAVVSHAALSSHPVVTPGPLHAAAKPAEPPASPRASAKAAEPPASASPPHPAAEAPVSPHPAARPADAPTSTVPDFGY
jgi:serine/threonine protein kinase